MPQGRRGRAAVMLLCTALAVALAYLVAGAVHPAVSARAKRRPAGPPIYEQARKPPRAARHSELGARWEQLGKALSRPLATAVRKATTYGIAFFGDSVSVGFGASDRRRGYVARVSTWLRMRGNRVVTAVHAKGGVTVSYWEHAPMPKKLDVAVVELGTNDVRVGTPAAQFAQEYRTLTGRIRAANPKVQLLCLSVWPHRGGTSLEGVINAQIRAVCPGTYVDITRLGDRWGIRSSDGFHPNDAGYRLIARAVEAKLKTG